MNNNQFYSENHYANYRNNKFSPSNQDHQLLIANQLVPLQPPLTFNLDNEIDATHGSHKCHRDSMDVSILIGFSFHYSGLISFNRFIRSLHPLHHLKPFYASSSVNFARNISITIGYRQLTVGRGAHISACVNRAITRFVIRMASTAPSWRWRTRNI